MVGHYSAMEIAFTRSTSRRLCGEVLGLYVRVRHRWDSR
jgi:hypothetical protein